jgi:hypothetical protein
MNWQIFSHNQGEIKNVRGHPGSRHPQAPLCSPFCARGQSIIYNAGMPKRQIGVEVLVEDHFWNDAHSRYVYSFHCPACAELRLTPELGIYRCDCGSWLIVTNQR